MPQIFVESIYERHVNWTDLVKNDDNYKNILQVIIQKEFKFRDYNVLLPYVDEFLKMYTKIFTRGYTSLYILRSWPIKISFKLKITFCIYEYYDYS